MNDNQNQSFDPHRQATLRDPDEIQPEEAKHELRVLKKRRIELELQNDQLRRAQQELQAQNEELQRAQQALAAARAKYFDLYDLAPVGYLAFDAAGILDANLVATILLGVEREQLLGQPFNSFILAEDQPSYDRLIKQLSGTGAPQAGELRLLKKDGEPFWARIQAYATQESQGEMLCRVVISDISQRKQMEVAQRQSEARFRTLFEQAAVGVALVETRTGRYIDINQKYCDFLGYSPAEALNLSFQDVTHPEDVQENVDQNALLLAGKTREFSIEKRYVRKDGRVVWGHLTVSPLWSPGETPAVHLHIAVVQDISGRKQAEFEKAAAREALRQSEEQFRCTFDQSPVGAGIFSLDYRFVRANQALCDMLGYAAEELTALSFPDITHPQDLAANLRHTQQLLAGEIEQFDMEKRYIRKDGGIVWALLSVRLVKDAAGKALFFVSMMVDITERNQLIDKMIEAQKAASLGTLAAGAAHEINSPLQVITGSSESLLKQLQRRELDCETLAQQIERIKYNGWRIARIVHGLLDYTSGANDFMPTNLNALVQDTLLLVESQLCDGSGIEITTELAEGLPELTCDRNKIAQALVNLLLNARDALPDGGTITIRSAYDRRAGKLLLAISDSGPGIPQAIRSRIFDPFFTTKPVGQGTGLGLSIALGVVRAHGGEILVESTEGQGTTLTLCLPLACAVQQDSPPVAFGRYEEVRKSW